MGRTQRSHLSVCLSVCVLHWLQDGEEDEGQGSRNWDGTYLANALEATAKLKVGRVEDALALLRRGTLYGMNADLSRALAFTGHHLDCWEQLTHAILANLSDHRASLRRNISTQAKLAEYAHTVEGIAAVYQEGCASVVGAMAQYIVRDFFEHYRALYGLYIFNSPKQDHLLASFYHSLAWHSFTPAASRLVGGMVDSPQQYPIPGILQPFLSALAQLPLLESYPGLRRLYHHIVAFYRAGPSVSVYHRGPSKTVRGGDTGKEPL